MKKKRKTNILIVDDNLKNLQVLGNALYSFGYLISVAKSGKQALQLIHKNQPDLILLDVMMPEMDGYETCKNLKASPETASIPVIFLTAKTETEDLIKGFQCGGVDYITKPFNRDELLMRIQTHVELKRSRETILKQSLHLQKLNASKDKLFTIISHDLRAPISTIESSLKSLKEDPEFIHQHLDELIDIAENTKTMIQNLLAWAKSQQESLEVKSQKINLNELIRDSIAVLKGKSEAKKIELTWEDSETLYAIADQEMIKTVLRNLISNAIKFTPSRGTIKITTQYIGDNVEVAVTDSGVGMDDQSITKILSPNSFHSTFGTNGEKGTGLGLNLCKDFITKNQGQLKIESIPHHGSKFSFVLPHGEKIPILSNK